MKEVGYRLWVFVWCYLFRHVSNCCLTRTLSLTAEQRAEDLLPRLTLEEKVSLMQNASPAIPRLGIKRI